MASQLKRIKNFFSAQYQKQRWLLLIFKPEGLEVRRLIYFPTRRQVLEKSPMFFANVLEKNIRSRRVLKVIAYLLFFPFRYRVSVVASRTVCRSVYFTIPFERKNPLMPIEKNEVSGIFSQYLWKYLEINKKAFVKDNSYDDLGVLLLNSLVVNVSLDGKSLGQNDELFGKTGKKVAIGMVQTFVFRPFFSSLAKIFPKRAPFRDFHEFGFYLPLAVLLNHLKVSEKKNKKFIFAGVEKLETKIHVFDGLTMAFYDIFSFGNRSFYEAMNHYFGVDITTYFLLLDKIIKDDLALSAKKRFMDVLDKELINLNNGISSFKNEIRAPSVYLSSENITGYLKLNKHFAEMVVDDDFCNKVASINMEALNLSCIFKADIGCMLGFSRNDQLNILATRQIRWLIPHTVEVR